jgi:thioredoxin-related protein
MNVRTSVVLVGAFLALSLSRAHAKPVPPPLEQAIMQAAAAGKPLLVELAAEWCSPCEDFEEMTLPNKRVQAALANVVFVRYDAENGVGELANARLRAPSFPTFVVLDGDGIEVFRQTGALSPSKFIALIERARHDTVGEAQIKSWVNAKPGDVANLVVAANWFRARGRTPEAIGVYERVSTHAVATERQRSDAKAALDRLRKTLRPRGPR